MGWFGSLLVVVGAFLLGGWGGLCLSLGALICVDTIIRGDWTVSGKEINRIAYKLRNLR